VGEVAAEATLLLIGDVDFGAAAGAAAARGSSLPVYPALAATRGKETPASPPMHQHSSPTGVLPCP
jgi:hypothetical protein